MEIANQIKLQFVGVDFPVVNFNSDQLFVFSKDNEISLSVVPKVFYPKKDNTSFKIIQEVSLSAQGYFDLFVVAVGTFQLENAIDDATKRQFINTNAPAIMFPYVRAFIATLTTNLGNVTGTMHIPPQFFKGDLEEVEV